MSNFIDLENVTRIWTDGSALANPRGAMGWAWADEDGRHDSGGARMGTNQIGELCAVLQALVSHPRGELLIITDSEYALNCSTRWAKAWEGNGWRTRDGRPVKNGDLVRAIRFLITRRADPVHFSWTKGHAGNEGNELVDRLARDYAVGCEMGTVRDKLPPAGRRAVESNASVNRSHGDGNGRGGSSRHGRGGSRGGGRAGRRRRGGSSTSGRRSRY